MVAHQHALAQAFVVFTRQACQVVPRGKVVQVGAHGPAQHGGAGRVIDAGADHQLAVGGHLQQLDEGFAFKVDHLGCIGVQAQQVGAQLGQHGFVVEGFDHGGAGQGGQVEGVHAARPVTDTFRDSGPTRPRWS
ncbi:hypothetical protein D3C71_1635510 [compost metagenome]